MPPRQACPEGQTLPHMPQFDESISVSTQRPLQAVNGRAQGTHVPSRHI